MAGEHRIDPTRLAALREREDARFVSERPRSHELLERRRSFMPHGVPTSWMATLWDHPAIYVAEGSGVTFTDVDGHAYLDFHIGDTSLFCGYTPEPVVRTVAARAARGVHERTVALGARLADGIQAAADEAGLGWRAHRL